MRFNIIQFAVLPAFRDNINSHKTLLKKVDVTLIISSAGRDDVSRKQLNKKLIYHKVVFVYMICSNHSNDTTG